jgi:hypothetical protein
MPRTRRVNHPIEKKISLPADIVTAVELELWSDLEGKVPYGAWSKLVERLLRDHLRKEAPHG